MQPARILIVDDDALVAAGIKSILVGSPELPTDVVGIARDGQEAVLTCAAVQPDIVLMDLRMPHLSGVEATAAIKAAYPEIRVLALTTFSTQALVVEALRAGAGGYLVKDRAGDDLIDALRAVLADEFYLSPDAAAALGAYVAQHPTGVAAGGAGVPTAGDDLNERERDMITLLAQGRSNAEMAAEMFLSLGTVKALVSSACHKLGVRDRVQLLVRTIELGLAEARLRADDGNSRAD